MLIAKKDKLGVVGKEAQMKQAKDPYEEFKEIA